MCRKIYQDGKSYIVCIDIINTGKKQRVSINSNRNVIFLFTVRGDIKMFRSCATVEYKDKGKNACYKTVMEEYNTYVCTCDENGCNGAEKIQMPSMFMIVLSVLLMALLKQ